MVYFDSGLGDDKPKTPASTATLVGISVILGVFAIVMYFINLGAGAAVFGGMGLVLGGFSFGRAFTAPGNLRKIFTALVAVSLILSVMGFMLGFASLVG